MKPIETTIFVILGYIKTTELNWIEVAPTEAELIFFFLIQVSL